MSFFTSGCTLLYRITIIRTLCHTILTEHSTIHIEKNEVEVRYTEFLDTCPRSLWRPAPFKRVNKRGDLPGLKPPPTPNNNLIKIKKVSYVHGEGPQNDFCRRILNTPA